MSISIAVMLLFYTGPAFVAVLSVIFLKEKFTLSQVVLL
nr:EamA family transporter [Siminovitchia fordii]